MVHGRGHSSWSNRGRARRGHVERLWTVLTAHGVMRALVGIHRPRAHLLHVGAVRAVGPRRGHAAAGMDRTGHPPGPSDHHRTAGHSLGHPSHLLTLHHHARRRPCLPHHVHTLLLLNRHLGVLHSMVLLHPLLLHVHLLLHLRGHDSHGATLHWHPLHVGAARHRAALDVDHSLLAHLVMLLLLHHHLLLLLRLLHHLLMLMRLLLHHHRPLLTHLLHLHWLLRK